MLAAMVLFSENAIADPVLDKILKTQNITLAWVDNTKPISWQLNGQPTGMAIDLCLDVVENLKQRYKTDINVTWKKVPTAARFDVIAHHQADILCAVAANSGQRNKLVSFSIPWLYTKMNYLTKKSDNINHEEMLAGHTVGAISGGTSAIALAKMNKEFNYSISVKLVRDFNEGFNLLAENHISAFLTDDIIIRGKLVDIPDRENYQMSPEGFGETLSYGLVVSKDAYNMKDIIDEEIKTLFTSRQFDKLYSKWFMSPITPSGESVKQPMSDLLIDEENRLQSTDDNSSQF
ncbi:transporter substrate-binding domain-containing protein [Buttiauxella izardii]|uniref:Solute-binding protein family 3/N-terminal domain-containing protein n=1 Tax=Buttiauxella izardii TaxID=82991 RepID=A0A3A5JW45_9ENTR|nr:transporter substrate-binding domain-containing protein [Buttiauxella izardii]RJT21380.1 hypothetical protein D6029_14495 [Buttiauxella izardii]